MSHYAKASVDLSLAEMRQNTRHTNLRLDDNDPLHTPFASLLRLVATTWFIPLNTTLGSLKAK